LNALPQETRNAFLSREFKNFSTSELEKFMKDMNAAGDKVQEEIVEEDKFDAIVNLIENDPEEPVQLFPSPSIMKDAYWTIFHDQSKFSQFVSDSLRLTDATWALRKKYKANPNDNFTDAELAKINAAKFTYANLDKTDPPSREAYRELIKEGKFTSANARKNYKRSILFPNNVLYENWNQKQQLHVATELHKAQFISPYFTNGGVYSCGTDVVMAAKFQRLVEDFYRIDITRIEGLAMLDSLIHSYDLSPGEATLEHCHPLDMPIHTYDELPIIKFDGYDHCDIPLQEKIEQSGGYTQDDLKKMLSGELETKHIEHHH